ncbi:COMM domain-containing protein 7-like [Corticium candelabrum]|uniref:COMM domain-containing protein 7-like n=1 Tax=Corticium candelabrum TaxID=121492 RepID=UPI002E268600|nr:COMM domain-containing protein 7-like [Corticium candelabrum]
MALHFTAESVDDQMYTDFGNLSRLSYEPFAQLTAIVFGFLTEPHQSARLLSQLETFASELGVNPGALRNILQSLLTFFKAALKKNLSPTFVKEDLEQLGLAAEKATHIGSEWKSHLMALSRATLGQTLTVNRLVDMDWRFGVTAASSDVKKAGTTFLQVKFTLDRGTETEDVFMELTLQQFYQFLHEMEKAKTSLDFMS